MSDAQIVHFEAARAEHAGIFVSMMRALENADPGPTPFDEERRRIIFQKFVSDPTFGRAWLIVKADEPVGYVILTVSFSFEFRGLDAFIDELYVAEAHRGQGIGQRAMAFVEDAARELRINAIHLEVSKNNAGALELYRRAGYVDHGRYLMTKWLIRAA